MEPTAQTSRQPREAGKRSQRGYSPTQRETIRDALLAHRRYTLDADGKSLGWGAICLDIEDYTGVSIGEEVVRRFANRHPQKTSAESVAAVADYLMHPEIDALRPEELQEEKVDFHAALRLIQYLRRDWQSPVQTLSASPAFSGSFQAVTAVENKLLSITLKLQPPSEDGIIAVQERRDFYTYSPEFGDFDSWSGKEKKKRWRSHKDSTGWAFVTPEDNLIFFLRQYPFPANHYYWLMIEVNFWSVKNIEDFVLANLDYPAEPVEDGAGQEIVAGAVAAHIKSNLLFFRKIPKQIETR